MLDFQVVGFAEVAVLVASFLSLSTSVLKGDWNSGELVALCDWKEWAGPVVRSMVCSSDSLLSSSR